MSDGRRRYRCVYCERVVCVARGVAEPSFYCVMCAYEAGVDDGLFGARALAWARQRFDRAQDGGDFELDEAGDLKPTEMSVDQIADRLVSAARAGGFSTGEALTALRQFSASLPTDERIADVANAIDQRNRAERLARESLSSASDFAAAIGFGFGWPDPRS